MKPKQLRVPAPIHHRPSGRDVVFVRDAEGKRRMVYLGEHGSTEAARRYREVLSERLAGKPVTTAASAGREPTSEWPTVAQLCAAFLLDAERYYDGAAGNRSREVDSFRLALRTLLRLHRDTPTDRCTINDLIEVRQALIDGEYGYQDGKSGRRDGVGGKKRSRTYINATGRRIKQVFRWGTERRMSRARSGTSCRRCAACRSAGAPRARRARDRAGRGRAVEHDRAGARAPAGAAGSVRALARSQDAA